MKSLASNFRFLARCCHLACTPTGAHDIQWRKVRMLWAKMYRCTLNEDDILLKIKATALLDFRKPLAGDRCSIKSMNHIGFRTVNNVTIREFANPTPNRHLVIIYTGFNLFTEKYMRATNKELCDVILKTGFITHAEG